MSSVFKKVLIICALSKFLYIEMKVFVWRIVVISLFLMMLMLKFGAESVQSGNLFQLVSKGLLKPTDANRWR